MVIRTSQITTATGSALLYAVASGFYIDSAYHSATTGDKTVLATWVLFFITVVAGLISYYQSDDQKRHWLLNICNTADVIAVLVVLAAVIGFHAYDEIVRPFDVFVGSLWLAIMIMWSTTHNHKLAYKMFNVALVIAYLPLVQGLLTIDSEHAHGEPYGTWTAIFLASILGLYAPLSNRPRDGLAILYALRAVLSTGLVLVLMLKIDGLL